MISALADVATNERRMPPKTRDAIFMCDSPYVFLPSASCEPARETSRTRPTAKVGSFQLRRRPVAEHRNHDIFWTRKFRQWNTRGRAPSDIAWFVASGEANGAG